ncbi:MAG: phosphoglycerate kinase [Alphaproteobacteria bacterium]|nr:phosphoglycerate kinase [Alphaproteobacteria bacterium]MCL2889919.1 phosphoglycerate kinase [Alphaproteobacteria bacterium]
MNIRTINELTDIAGKYILLRDDFNVQIVDGKIMDTFRIEQSLPTIRRLQEMGARIAIVSHLGRPDGAPDSKFSLAPVAFALSELLGEPVPLISDCIGESVADARRNMENGDVVLLENVRFHGGEESNDSEFAAALAHGFNIYINDAFAVSHRAHASTVGVTKFLPAYAGELLASEIAELSHVMNNPTRPLMAIVSGAKLNTKIDVLESMVTKCDTVAVCGGIGTTFAIASGKYNFTDMLYKPEYKEIVLRIMAAAEKHGCKILLPIDKGVGPEWAASAPRTDKTLSNVLGSDVIMDEGPESIAQITNAIDESKTIIWNGTVGMAEWPPVWSAGTFAIAKHIASRTRAGKLESIIGGGDTVAALEATDTMNDITYVSTGGGAFLEFIEGRALPGIVALEN